MTPYPALGAVYNSFNKELTEQRTGGHFVRTCRSDLFFERAVYRKVHLVHVKGKKKMSIMPLTINLIINS